VKLKKKGKFSNSGYYLCTIRRHVIIIMKCEIGLEYMSMSRLC